MNVGIPISDGRISPVFDVARKLLLVNIEQGCEIHRVEIKFDEQELAARARHVAELGTDVLICGAISRPLEAMVLSTGVELIPQTCGPVEDILNAFVTGKLTERDYVIPGCFGRRRRCRRRGRHGRCRDD